MRTNGCTAPSPRILYGRISRRSKKIAYNGTNPPPSPLPLTSRRGPERALSYIPSRHRLAISAGHEALTADYLPKRCLCHPMGWCSCCERSRRCLRGTFPMFAGLYSLCVATSSLLLSKRHLRALRMLFYLMCAGISGQRSAWRARCIGHYFVSILLYFGPSTEASSLLSTLSFGGREWGRCIRRLPTAVSYMPPDRLLYAFQEFI
jgi:hypothetical protein